MPPFSLLVPMPGLPWYLLPLWPLIFWRIQRLKAWFRATGHPGAQMLWGVMWNGRVVLIRLSDDMSVQRSCRYRAPVSDRLGLALTDTQPRCPGCTPGTVSVWLGHASGDPGLRRAYGLAGAVPDT
ncbi:hypothetical protein [Hyphomonas johnsonii]|uniref:Uncharacterized protein n=1 Tax=Hyphomonas johnsonii MHS-2 TaxID=1280950 RepID=A0A059FCQ0_9PROT|nr:hypothetical protein [Hyphomonas johnsonii]KCZ88321.1 hypothetical protein HJO_15703 [Hyphomonas johnsonii MHS-2]